MTTSIVSTLSKPLLELPELLSLSLLPKFVTDVGTLVLSSVPRGRSSTALNPAYVAASQSQNPRVLFRPIPVILFVNRT